MPNSTQVRRTLTNLAAKRAQLQRDLSRAEQAKATKERQSSDHTASASRTSSPSSRRSYERRAETARKAALAESKKVADLTKKLAVLVSNEARQQKELDSALARESLQARREQEREQRRQNSRQKAEDRRRRSERQQDQRAAETLIDQSEHRVTERMVMLMTPKDEELRILYATASPNGNIRVDEEMRRVKAAVRASTHRDLVSIEHLPAATPGDLLDGLVAFRPHVVHFSGHGSERVLVFDDGGSSHSDGIAVTASAFKAAVEAPDDPPRLVVLNSCRSAGQLQALLGAAPLVVGMSDNVGDLDAMTFATRFYGSLAEGQSVASAIAIARAEMQMNGLPDHELPTLVFAQDVDASATRLIAGPSTP